MVATGSQQTLEALVPFVLDLHLRLHLQRRAARSPARRGGQDSPDIGQGRAKQGREREPVGSGQRTAAAHQAY